MTAKKQRIFRNRFFSWILIVFSILSLWTVTAAENSVGNEFLVIGAAKITGSNEALEREEALFDAFKKAMETYLTKRLGNQGLINNFPKIAYDLLPKARDLIENFYILNELRLEKEIKILVRVKINEKVMEKKLTENDLILSQGPPIKVLFLIFLTGPQPDETIYWWKDPQHQIAPSPIESYFIRTFEESGIQVLNRLTLPPLQSLSEDMSSPQLTEEALSKWGSAFSADVVVYGKCDSTANKEINIALQAKDIKKAGFIAEDSLNEKGLEGANMGLLLERAVNKICRRSAPLIIKSFENKTTETHPLEIIITGLKSFKQFKEIKGFLEKRVKGTQSVTQTGAQGDSIAVRVEFSGDIQKYMAALANQQGLSAPFQIEKREDGKIIFKIR